MGDRRRRRRRLASAATVAGLVFTAAACGSGSDSAGGGGPNTLEVWTRSNPDSAATYDRVTTVDATPGKDKYEVVPAPAGPAGSDVLADGENVCFGARTAGVVRSSPSSPA